MSSKETEAVVKNIDYKDDADKKKNKKIKINEVLEELNKELEEELDDDIDEEDYEEDDEEDNDEEDDDEEDDDEEDADGLTDIGLYNVLGNFMVDEDGNTIGVSLSNIAKELAKLNHTLKKYVGKN